MSKARAWFIAILFFSGLCLTLYPFVSNLVVQSNASKAVNDYNESVAQMDQEDIDAAKEAVKKYNEQLGKAVSSSAEQEETVSYLDMVDVGESIGILEIPKIDVDLPIYSGADPDVLEKGVGHLPETSFPSGGPGTHCVLTGHRGLPKAVLLTDLDKLEIGDVFYIHVLDEVLAYQVDQINVVLPDETDDLRIVPGEDYCTLVTCTPYAVNTHRLLVRGERTEYVPEDAKQQRYAYSDVQSGTLVKRLVDVWPWLTFSLVLMAAAETTIFLLIGRRSRRKEKQKKWDTQKKRKR